MPIRFIGSEKLFTSKKLADLRVGDVICKSTKSRFWMEDTSTVVCISRLHTKEWNYGKRLRHYRIRLSDGSHFRFLEGKSIQIPYMPK